MEGYATVAVWHKEDILVEFLSLPSCSPTVDTPGIIYGDINLHYHPLVWQWSQWPVSPEESGYGVGLVSRFVVSFCAKHSHCFVDENLCFSISFFHDARSSNSLVPGLILDKFSLFGRKSLLRQSGGLSEFVQKIKLNFLINTWHSLTKIELSNVSLVENYLKISSVWAAPLKIWYYENITVSGEFVLRDFALLVSAWCEWVFGLYLAGFSSFGTAAVPTWFSHASWSCGDKNWDKLNGEIQYKYLGPNNHRLSSSVCRKCLWRIASEQPKGTIQFLVEWEIRDKPFR